MRPAAPLRFVAHAANGPMIRGRLPPKATNILPKGAFGVQVVSEHKMKVADRNNPKVSYWFSVTNDTAVSQTVDLGGSPFFTLAPAGIENVCGYGAQTGLFTFGRARDALPSDQR